MLEALYSRIDGIRLFSDAVRNGGVRFTCGRRAVARGFVGGLGKMGPQIQEGPQLSPQRDSKGDDDSNS
jgi:hypothetical protein